jgi:hypothetical protein
MREPDRGLGLVDVLSARPACPHRVGLDVGLLDVDFDAVVDHRIGLNAGE